MSKVWKKIPWERSQTFQPSWFDRETHRFGSQLTVLRFNVSKADSETENLKISGQVSHHDPLH